MLTPLTISRACSAVAMVCLRVLPGGSSRYTWVWELSSGGMKPLGNKGTSMMEPMKNSVASTMVTKRCFMHQVAQTM